MARITPEARAKFDDRFEEYREMADGLHEHNEKLRESLDSANGAVAYKRIELAESLLDLASLQVIRNQLHVRFLRVPDNHLLDEAKAACDQSLIMLEQVVGDTIDAPLSEITARLDAIEDLSDEARCSLVRKAGFTIQSVAEEHGEDNRYKWYFVDLEGRFAVVARNILNLRTLVVGMDPRVAGYEDRFLHLTIVKDALDRSATELRKKFEMSSQQITDIRRAILFFSALRRIHMLLGETQQAEDVRQKMLRSRKRMDEVEAERT